MTTASQYHVQRPVEKGLATAVVVSWKAPIAMGVLSLVAVALLLTGRTGNATFQLTPATAKVALPDVVWSALPAGIILTGVLIVFTALSAFLSIQGKRLPLWMSVAFGVVFLIAFLTWAAAGSRTPIVPVTGLLVGAISLSVPLIFGALSGVINERVGVVNIAIEGQFLAGAFSSAVVATITGQAFLGLVAAAVAGVLVSLVLGVFAIRYVVDQVIVGVVLNVLVIGLTSFLFSQVLTQNGDQLNSPPRFSPVAIPVLADIPLLGPTFFNQTVIVYVMYAAVVAVYIGLFKTRWGLRLRAVGEHPQAADTVGINVARTRFVNVAIGGAIAGFGGAFFTLGSVGVFSKEMTAGAGFIALAAVIFGGWDPVRATFAALLFGFAGNLQNTLSVMGSPVPSEFMLMLPYVVTLLAVAGFVGQVRGPAAAGKPYIKG